MLIKLLNFLGSRNYSIKFSPPLDFLIIAEPFSLRKKRCKLRFWSDFMIS